MMRPLLSIVVPLAPDESEWQGLREQLNALSAGSEIIVVRPGTVKGHDTRTIATSMTMTCEIVAPPGRARQLNAGARAAQGTWLWFLHADSRLHPRTLPALHAFLARGKDALGYFDLRYRDDGPWLSRVNAIGANFRARYFGLPFGDQGYVLPAAWFARLGPYDEAAAYGEDHLLVWRARAAGLPVVRTGAPLFSSARKYAREGWLHTTTKHLVLTARQAWPQWRRSRDGSARRATSAPQEIGNDSADSIPMRGAAALAIFVKTPGHSPIKTRLAATIGESRAIAFHRLAAQAVAQVASVVSEAGRGLQPYWAVAEADALTDPAWASLSRNAQGDGDLGARLHHVYSTLQARHGRVLLVGADAPQLTADFLRTALAALADPATPFVLGEARDGGFWLFGGSAPIAQGIWRGVRYSQTHTARELRAALTPLGGIADLPMLTDVDSAADLDALADALDALPEPLPAQRVLRDWLHTLPEPSLSKGLHA